MGARWATIGRFLTKQHASRLHVHQFFIFDLFNFIIMKYITIYYKSYHLLISQDYAALNSLKNGYKICSEKEYHQILIGHCEYQIRKIETLIAANQTLN